MSFYESFTEAFIVRFGHAQDMAPLKNSAEYRDRLQAFEAALDSIPDRETAQEIRQAVFTLGDVVTQFYYRAGLKDGVSINSDSFTTPCLAG